MTVISVFVTETNVYIKIKTVPKNVDSRHRIYYISIIYG
jgi:hypothetical protein